MDLRGSRPLKVVVDAGNGMAGLTTPAVLGDALLPKLPLEIVPLYFELDGSFPNHPANPLEPANLLDLQAAVVEHGADIGLAFDGDADRCFVIDEKGNPVSPSAVTGMVARREIARARAAGRGNPHDHPQPADFPRGPRADRAATAAGPSAPGWATPSSRPSMADEGAIFGGEHSAHFYFRDFWNADTGMLAAMHVLAALGEQDGPLSELGREYEPYSLLGGNQLRNRRQSRRPSRGFGQTLPAKTSKSITWTAARLPRRTAASGSTCARPTPSRSFG